MDEGGRAAPGREVEEELDALGRKRSSRSIRTGPGSRGGKWHDLAWRRAYWRQWRAEHAEYRKREQERKARRRAARREAINEPTFVEAIVRMVKADAKRRGRQAIADDLLIDVTTLDRYLYQGRLPSAEVIDAIVDRYGAYICVREYRAQVREARQVGA